MFSLSKQTFPQDNHFFVQQLCMRRQRIPFSRNYNISKMGKHSGFKQLRKIAKSKSKSYFLLKFKLLGPNSLTSNWKGKTFLLQQDKPDLMDHQCLVGKS